MVEGNMRRWKHLKDPKYLLPHYVLADRFRNRLREALKAANFKLYLKIPPKVWNRKELKHWVCDVKAVGSGEPAIGYLARYVTKTAIGSKQLRLEGEGKQTRVLFDYKDSDTNQVKTCRLEPLEFLRRFLQHVLPRRFRAVRCFGWMSPAAKKTFDRISMWLKGFDYRPPSYVSDRRYPKCRKCGGPLLPSDDEVPEDLQLAYERNYYRKHSSHRPRPPDLVITRGTTRGLQPVEP
jgi:hypothetical protein